MSKPIISDNSPLEDYQKILDLNVCDVFKVEGNYETVMRRIEEYTPEGMIFEVCPITPGTSLYTVYGPDHCIVTNKLNG